MKKITLLLVVLSLLLLLTPLAATATTTTLNGNIYNSKLELEKNVLIEIDTTPVQKFLSKDGFYSFELPTGKYTLTAKNEEYIVKEEVEIVGEGSFVFDVFLLPDFIEEDELWQETELGIEIDTEETDWKGLLPYFAAGLLFLMAIYRIIKVRRKYGPLKIFRRKIKAESKKTIEEHKEELEQEPGYLDKALEIIKKHDGRITQKDLRKEMLSLSEAKVSLIITELEHKDKVEKVKKGRGNVLILKE